MRALKIVLALLWALPVTGVAVIVSIPVVTIPLGFFLLWVACYPLYRQVQNIILTHLEKEYADHALANDEPKPWEEE